MCTDKLIVFSGIGNWLSIGATRCVSATQHQTAKQYSKTGRKKNLKHLQGAIYHCNTCQDILKIQSLWEAALETEQWCFQNSSWNQMWLPLYQCHLTLSTQFQNTHTIIVLLTFNIIPQRSHHSLSLPRSWYRYSATATLTPGDGTTAIKV